MTATLTRNDNVTTAVTTPMVGDELLTFVKKNTQLGKTELALATGYTSQTKTGETRARITAMLDALTEASGIHIGATNNKKGVAGRSLSYKARVQGNGNIILGKAYGAVLGLAVGEEFEIKLNKNSHTIRLVPTSMTEEEAQAEEAA